MPAAVWPHHFDWFWFARRTRGHEADHSRGSRPGFEPDVALTIRRARPEDASVLAELAELDSAQPLRGDVLVAMREERPVAALELAGDREVANPFWPSETALAMLRVRAGQLRDGAAPLRARGRHGARATRTGIR